MAPLEAFIHGLSGYWNAFASVYNLGGISISRQVRELGANFPYILLSDMSRATRVGNSSSKRIWEVELVLLTFSHTKLEAGEIVANTQDLLTSIRRANFAMPNGYVFVDIESLDETSQTDDVAVNHSISHYKAVIERMR